MSKLTSDKFPAIWQAVRDPEKFSHNAIAEEYLASRSRGLLSDWINDAIRVLEAMEEQTVCRMLTKQAIITLARLGQLECEKYRDSL